MQQQIGSLLSGAAVLQKIWESSGGEGHLSAAAADYRGWYHQSAQSHYQHTALTQLSPHEQLH